MGVNNTWRPAHVCVRVCVRARRWPRCAPATRKSPRWRRACTTARGPRRKPWGCWRGTWRRTLVSDSDDPGAAPGFVFFTPCERERERERTEARIVSVRHCQGVWRTLGVRAMFLCFGVHTHLTHPCVLASRPPCPPSCPPTPPPPPSSPSLRLHRPHSRQHPG